MALSMVLSKPSAYTFTNGPVNFTNAGVLSTPSTNDMITFNEPVNNLTTSIASAASGSSMNAYILGRNAQIARSDSGLPTDTEMANHQFLLLAKQIPGVVVRSYGGQTFAERSFTVEVPSLWDEAVERVADLESSLFLKFPQARLDVHIRGRKELASSYGEAQTAACAE